MRRYITAISEPLFYLGDIGSQAVSLQSPTCYQLKMTMNHTGMNYEMLTDSVVSTYMFMQNPLKVGPLPYDIIDRAS